MGRARAQELRRVRRVLDFVPESTIRGWSVRRYYDALARRLHREVDATAATPPVVAASVRTPALHPDEWQAARDAAETRLRQESELEDLRRRLEEHKARLEETAHEEPAAVPPSKVHLQLLGARRLAQPEPEPVAEAPIEQPPAEEPLAEEVPAEEPAEEQESTIVLKTPQQEAEESIIVAPTVDPRLAVAELNLSGVREALASVHERLARLAVEERAMVAAGVPGLGGPQRFGDHTLYARLRGPRRGRRVDYVFSSEPVPDALPVPRPRRAKAREDPETGVPFLVSSSSPGE